MAFIGIIEKDYIADLSAYFTSGSNSSCTIYFSAHFHYCMCTQRQRSSQHTAFHDLCFFSNVHWSGLCVNDAGRNNGSFFYKYMPGFPNQGYMRRYRLTFFLVGQYGEIAANGKIVQAEDIPYLL
ncbi:hypothetical protein D9M68_888690 [compost metagenome]